jgi:hypothetical protein
VGQAGGWQGDVAAPSIGSSAPSCLTLTGLTGLTGISCCCCQLVELSKAARGLQLYCGRACNGRPAARLVLDVTATFDVLYCALLSDSGWPDFTVPRTAAAAVQPLLEAINATCRMISTGPVVRPHQADVAPAQRMLFNSRCATQSG